MMLCCMVWGQRAKPVQPRQLGPGLSSKREENLPFLISRADASDPAPSSTDECYLVDRDALAG